MHRWLLRLISPWESFAFEGEGEQGSAAPSDGGAPPAPSSDGGAPAGSAPSSTGASPQPSGAEPASTPERDAFEFLGFSDDEDAVPSVTVPAPEAQPPAAQAPAPGAAPAAPVAQAPTPPQAQPGAQVPQGTPQGEVPSIPADPGELLQSMVPHLPQLVEAMAQNYTLTKEEVDAFEADPTATLPKLLAKVHLQAGMAVLHNIKQFVPKMIQTALQQNTRRDEALKAFFDSHKALDRNNAAHREAIQRLGTAYRRANPSVPREQAIRDIGMLAMQALNLSAAPAGPGPNGTTVRTQPFVPAMGGGASGPTPTPPADKWSGMGEYFDDEN